MGPSSGTSSGSYGSGRDTSEPSSHVGDDQPIKLGATLVNLPLLVSDRSGRFIPQLTKNDFEIYEDGARQQVAFFGADEVPFNVALLLDVSPSTSNSFEDIQDAALTFVRELRSQDRVMVVSFDQNVRFLTGLTNNRREIERAIESIHTGNGTSVYEAVYDTVVNRLRNVEGRKALILLSDGEDTTSRSVGYDDAINAVTESDVLVYGLRYPDTGSGGGYGPSNSPRIRLPFPVPFPWPRGGSGPYTHLGSSTVAGDADFGQWQWPRRGGRRSDRGRDFMTDVATAGGGPVYDAKGVQDMSRLAGQIADELRHVYVISYYPTNPLSNGGYRTIRVSVAGRPDIAVRHRRGYYADSMANKQSGQSGP
ncbi:MAG TPA: VWA domain-containing protein [Blastocatellia bacterium]|nr:VWA domain-containing protein [Blastocatellia bacterium]